MIYLAQGSTPLGDILLSSNGEALTGLWFEDQKYFAFGLSDLNSHPQKDLPLFEQVFSWLDIYFSGREPHFTPPLHPQGTAFRQQVWQQLLDIPYGHTLAYSDLGSPRAIGQAVGHNPISIIIPCHRVVGKNENLTGYAGGLERKTALLQLEGWL